MSRPERTSPVRMCIGCRGRANKSELLRLVWRDQLLVDLAQREPGRGAYLHSAPECLDNAVRRRTVGRALRRNLDAVELRTAVAPFVGSAA